MIMNSELCIFYEQIKKSVLIQYFIIKKKFKSDTIQLAKMFFAISKTRIFFLSDLIITHQ